MRPDIQFVFQSHRYLIFTGPVNQLQVKIVLEIWSLQNFIRFFADPSLLRYFGFVGLVCFQEAGGKQGDFCRLSFGKIHDFLVEVSRNATFFENVFVKKVLIVAKAGIF